MSGETASDRLSRRLAFYGILFGAIIALGTVFVSIGGALVFSVIPELYDTIQAEKKLTQLNQTNTSEFNDKFNLITWEANSSTFFICGGLILIGLGIGNAYVFMIRRPRHAHTQIQIHSHNIHDTYNSDKEIQDKFDALTNIELKDPGLLSAKELHKIIIAQMNLTKSLFKRQHDDAKDLTKHSEKLKKYTWGLVGLTILLIAVAVIQMWIQATTFNIENFPAHVSILGGAPLILDQLNYSNAHIVGHITISAVIPHNSQLLVNRVTFDPIQYDPTNNCQFKNPQVKLENNVTIYLSKDVSNLADVSIPLIINSTWDIHPYFVNLNSTHPYSLTKMTVYGEITDLQTNQVIVPNIVQPTDVLVHVTHENLCTLGSVADSSQMPESVKTSVSHTR